MPYYTRDDEAVDDFDEYDPTPYGGGFDLFVTYGRPISPCEETCYPHSAGNDDEFDYERPQFESYAEPSAYGDDALQAEYSSYSRPDRRPGYQVGGRPQPAYGSEEYGSEGHGSGYGRRPGGYGREEEQGSGYGRRPEYGSQGYGEEQGGGYGYERPEYERPTYGDDPPRRPSYGRSEEEDYRRPSYGRSEEEDYRKPSYERRDDDDEDRYGYGGEEGYGRKKYGGDSDDDEEKHSRRHHHRRNYDDDE